MGLRLAGMVLTISYSFFSNSLIRAKNWFVKNGTVNFGRNIPTEIEEYEVIPNIPVRRNRNGAFHLTCSDRSFRNLWHNGKQPLELILKCNEQHEIQFYTAQSTEGTLLSMFKDI